MITSLAVWPDGWTATTQRFRVSFELPFGSTSCHVVTLTWDGSTDRPNQIVCNCGRRSCIPLRLVRDLERHNGLPRLV